MNAGVGFCAVGLLVGWLGDWGICVYLYSMLPFAVFSVGVYLSQLIGRKRKEEEEEEEEEEAAMVVAPSLGFWFSVRGQR